MSAPAGRRWWGALLIAAALAAVAIWGWRDYTAPGPLAEGRVVVVPHGAGVAAVAATLAENGVIRHPWSFIAGALADRR